MRIWQLFIILRQPVTISDGPLETEETRQVYNLFQNLWKKFSGFVRQVKKGNLSQFFNEQEEENETIIKSLSK